MATSKHADDSVTTGTAMGAGIYSFPQAAQIVERSRDVSRAQIRRWMTVAGHPRTTATPRRRSDFSI
ncbi:MAG: hypothetical protein OXH86_00190 [Acidimicrobiaceae bacterium]|nr:hypothetical protein [Acidimicrobiaceae bacterium]MDE0495745.1 hypothetical protein [Acidimicrobiaceae bacterium]